MTQPDLDRDLDRPEESSEADVTLVTRGVTVTACVEISTRSEVVVRPAGEGAEWKMALKPGDPVELYWVSGHEERTLAGRAVEVEEGLEPRWRLSVNGPAERSQRRKAVRARVELPVMMPWAGALLTGKTVDLSEAGMRAQMDGWGVPPDPGAALPVSLELGDVSLDVHGEIVWHSARGAQWLLAVRFDGVPERTADVLRRRVFEALRAHRAQTVS